MITVYHFNVAKCESTDMYLQLTELCRKRDFDALTLFVGNHFDKYDAVADMNLDHLMSTSSGSWDRLEEAFDLTQNVQVGWPNAGHPDVTKVYPSKQAQLRSEKLVHRSTFDGDLIRDGDTFFVVLDADWFCVPVSTLSVSDNVVVTPQHRIPEFHRLTK